MATVNIVITRFVTVPKATRYNENKTQSGGKNQKKEARQKIYCGSVETLESERINYRESSTPQMININYYLSAVTINYYK